MKKILIYSISMLLLGCGNNTKEERDSMKGTNSTGMTREEYMNSLDSVELQDSLAFCAPDTAFSTNADLLLLQPSSYDFEALRDSLGLDSKCVFLPYDRDIPNIKALFYIAVAPQDTFHYAVQDNDSIFLWAIVSGNGTHLVRDLN